MKLLQVSGTCPEIISGASHDHLLLVAPSEKNLTLQDTLYKLRAETQEAFDDAKALQARQKELEREQKELYQVGLMS